MDKDSSLTSFAEMVKNNSVNYREIRANGLSSGLRNKQGNGIIVGLTKISKVNGHDENEDEIPSPSKGKLSYRGKAIQDIILNHPQENEDFYYKTIFLILFGQEPNSEELAKFKNLLNQEKTLDKNIVNKILPNLEGKGIINKIQRIVLSLYQFDDQAENLEIENVIRQCLGLISKMPTIVAYSYRLEEHLSKGNPLILRQPKEDLSLAENFLYLLKDDGDFSKMEAETLELALILHAEHGGGNNSTFTTRVVTSAFTDTYSAVVSAISSIKGKRHGSSNYQVVKMIEDLKQQVSNWEDEAQIEDYLKGVIEKKNNDRSGLIYGIGHPVYTLSDPRAEILKAKTKQLAEEKNRMVEYQLYHNAATISSNLLNEKCQRNYSPNIDFYSGLLFQLLDLPKEIYTPLFIMGRIVGWSTHRLEELTSDGKIYRPKFKYIR